MPVKWQWVEQGEDDKPVFVVKTEAEILEVFYPQWSERMKKCGLEHLISNENCILDWVVVHWAHQV